MEGGLVATPHRSEGPRGPRLILQRRLGLALGVLLAATLGFAARADAFVYWSNGNGAQTFGSIGRANLDGTAVDQEFITGTLGDVTVDGAHVYWSNGYTRTIGRANLDGSGVDNSFITYLPSGYIANQPTAVAVDGAHVYWVDTKATMDCLSCPVVRTDTIWRANLDGTGAAPLIGDVPNSPVADLAVDAAHIYWTASNNTIARAGLDGTGIEQNFISMESDGSLYHGIAIDAASIYWTGDNGSIGRANLDGSGADSGFITGASHPQSVAVGGGHLYWTNDTSIGRANLDGSGITQRLVTGRHPVTAMAADALGPPPSNEFRFGKTKTNRKGVGKLTVKVVGPGEVSLARTGRVKGQRKRAAQSGELKLTIEAEGRAKKRLKKMGRAKVKAKVTYTPDGGTSKTKSKKITLVRR